LVVSGVLKLSIQRRVLADAGMERMPETRRQRWRAFMGWFLGFSGGALGGRVGKGWVLQ
jgi:hypothetical protein